MQNDIRIIALDLDGTLLDSEKRLSGRNFEALARAAEKGVHIVPTTGRFFGMMPAAVRDLPFVRYAITINGAQVYDRRTESAIVRDEIPLDTALAIMETLDGYDVIYDCYRRNWGWMTAALQEKAADYATDEHYLRMVREFRRPVPELKAHLRETAADGDVQKIMLFARRSRTSERTSLTLEAIRGELASRFPEIKVTSSTENNLEFNIRTAHKGNALKRFAEHLGLGLGNCMAFGDGMNDFTMVEAAGLGVAMANARPEVKRVAKWIAPSNDEDGVAAGLAKWVLRTVLAALVFPLAVFAGGAEAVRVTADFGAERGPVKPLHAVNNAPCRLQKGAKVWEFRSAGIPYMRTHDTVGGWGGGHYVDIPNLFPNFEADENDPASYDFAFTDAYLSAVVAAGTRIYYRLGVTIENNWRIKAYNIHPPKDFAKWARICEHVVRHYNEGWANGFRWNIEYWEIWNEPENPPMWTGTKEQYFELYRVAANHLKKCFPTIKVGGYGGCGFYSVDGGKSEQNEFQKSFVTWFEDFCRFVTDPRTKAPLDFYSWHMYICEKTPHRIVRHADYVRRTLDAAGLAKTESHFNEWNYVGPDWGDYWSMRHARGAAMFAQAFCLMQVAPVDLAMYYDACPTRTFCGLFDLVAKTADTRTTTFFAFRMWNRLYRLGTSVSCAADRDDFGAAAAKAADGRKALLLVNNLDAARAVDLRLTGADGEAFEVYLLDDEHDSKKPSPVDVRRPFTLSPYMTALVITPSKAAEKIDRGAERRVFAGQDAGGK